MMQDNYKSSELDTSYNSTSLMVEEFVIALLPDHIIIITQDFSHVIISTHVINYN